ncbi:hypothetical protein [Pedobacter sp.]|jgi:hypothetical protein|nr:hypothetical protein [Pedobacter sp.]HWW40709.1 hypothetical protein [Pedobacter sp.]
MKIIIGATLTADRLGNMNQAYSFNCVDNEEKGAKMMACLSKTNHKWKY